jgi:hypothetical protein
MPFVCRRHGALPCGQKAGVVLLYSDPVLPGCGRGFLDQSQRCRLSKRVGGASSRQCNDTTPDAVDVERNERRSIARVAFLEIRKERFRVESIAP